MNYVTTIILFLFVSNFKILSAQAPDTLWTRTYGGNNNDCGFSVRQTNDGGYIITGTTNPFGSSDDIWLIKTDDSGGEIWSKTYGGSYNDYAYCVEQTVDNGYIISGVTSSFGTTLQKIWLIKTDSTGDTVWTKIISSSHLMRCSSVQQTTDNGYILIGHESSQGNFSENVLLVKTDQSGSIIWTKTYDKNSYDVGNDGQQISDGGYIIVGTTGSIPGNIDVWLIKTNSSGDTLWTRTFGGINNESGWFVQQTSDGGYIIIGSSSQYFIQFGFDVWIIKTDSSGEMLWEKKYHRNYYDLGYAGQETSDGGYIISGYTGESFDNGSIWLIKTNSSGDTIWTNSFDGGNPGRSRSIQETYDGGYIITGTKNSFSSSDDIWLIKTVPDPSKLDAEGQTKIPTDYVSYQNYPNPFNPVTAIAFDLPKSSQVTLKVFSILGKEVTTLVSTQLPAGSYSYEWDASKLASGVYLYRIEVEGYVQTKKMILMK